MTAPAAHEPASKPGERGLDDTDRRLLDHLQGSLPLVPRLYAAVGRQLGLTELDVIRRVARLKDENIIRQIGPIFDSHRLGYRSTLCAFSVDPDRLDQVAACVSAHPGVSHNYSRDHQYNLWFTLTLPADRDMDGEISRLAAQPGVVDFLNLPALKVYKIGVRFKLAGEGANAEDTCEVGRAEGEPLSDFERQVVRATQGDLPAVMRPFLPAAALLGTTEEELLWALQGLQDRGALRRLSAVLRHRRAGFTANGMGCWAVPEHRVDWAGGIAAGFAEVSHCYHRQAHPPRWPYSLFTMIHGRERAEVQAAAERIRQAVGVEEYVLLFSEREYKKERVRYFEDS